MLPCEVVVTSVTHPLHGCRLRAYAVRHVDGVPHLKVELPDGMPGLVAAGATDALDRCDALVAELSIARYNKGAPLMAEAMSAIARHGLHCIDICELHRSPAGGVLQADFLFVKPRLFDRFCAEAGLR